MNNIYILHIQLGAVGGAPLEKCKEEALEIAKAQHQKVILKHADKSYVFYGRKEAP